MSGAKSPIRAAILAPPEATASTLFGVYDLLAAAGRDWQYIVRGEMGESLFEPGIVARDGAPFRTSAGVLVHPDYGYAECPTPALVVIPDVFVAPNEDITGRFDEEIAWVRHWYEQGALIATACTGGLLLAEGGLLDGWEATIHWGYAEAMARRYPRVSVHNNRALVITGADQRIAMAGGGTSWQDLALYLVARLVTTEEAMRVARVFLVNWHQVGQQPYAAVARRQVEDATIAKCQEWIAQSYEHAAPVNAMVELSGLPERSFKRRFAKATGLSPLAYVQTLRLEEAKHMLETTNESIEAIAIQVGYEDASYFSRLFRRRVGVTPAQYRKRFGGLRRTLEQHTSAA